jgi:hypothetical protein
MRGLQSWIHVPRPGRAKLLCSVEYYFWVVFSIGFVIVLVSVLVRIWAPGFETIGNNFNLQGNDITGVRP